MKIRIFILFFIYNLAFSQKNLELSKQIKLPFSVKYNFSNVLDSRIVKKNIGFYYEDLDHKNIFIIHPSLAVAIKNAIVSSTQSDSLRPQIIYEIKTFEFSEKIKSQSLINGKFDIHISFLKIINSDTVSLLDYSNQVNYTRSVSKKNDEYFEKIIENQLKYSFTYFNVWYYKNENIHEAFIEKTEISLIAGERREDSDTLIYGTRELNWQDFKGKPKYLTSFGGAIFASINYNVQFSISDNILKAKLSADAYMVKGMSWIRPDNKTEDALGHEKLHFDIAKVIIEKFKKQVQNFEAFSVDDLQSMIQLQYIDSYREMNRLQEQYDSETKHGLNIEKQKEWQEKIVRLLQ